MIRRTLAILRRAIIVVLSRVDVLLHRRSVKISAAALTIPIPIVWLLSYSWALGFQSNGERFEWWLREGSLYVQTFPEGFGAPYVLIEHLRPKSFHQLISDYWRRVVVGGAEGLEAHVSRAIA